MNRTVQTTQSRLHHFFTLAWSRKHLRQRDQNALRMRFLIFRRRQSYDHTKHTAHKEDFLSPYNGAFYRNLFIFVAKQTNQISSFDHPLKLEQSDCMF